MAIPVVSICARSFDPLGYVQMIGVVVYPPEVFRRVTRTATLDGGCAVYDGGSSVADSKLEIIAQNASKALVDSVMRLFSLWSRVSVSLSSGCYEAAPESARIESGNLVMSLLIIRSL